MVYQLHQFEMCASVIFVTINTSLICSTRFFCEACLQVFFFCCHHTSCTKNRERKKECVLLTWSRAGPAHWRDSKRDAKEGEKRTEEAEVKERVRHAPGALKVNLGNQIKTVFWPMSCRRERRDAEKRTQRIEKEDGQGDRRKRRREEKGCRPAASKTISNVYAARERRICRARAGGGQGFRRSVC